MSKTLLIQGNPERAILSEASVSAWKRRYMFKDKPCRYCNNAFTPDAPCNLYCTKSCKLVATSEKIYLRRKGYEAKTTVNYGVGKGGANKKGKEHFQYKTGKGFLNAHREYFKENVRYCQMCNKDLIEKVGRNSFCIHHIDHNPKNNPEDFSNWMLLCPRCHHLIHEKQTHLNVQRPVREDVQELGVLGNGEEPDNKFLSDFIRTSALVDGSVGKGVLLGS